MRATVVLLLLAAALCLAVALPDINHFFKKSPGCNTLKCILSFPRDHAIPPEELAALNPASLVDVILHMNDGRTVSSFSASSSPSSSFLVDGRAAAERITGVTIDHFVPPRSFAAAIPASSLTTLAAEPLILSITRLLPEHKFSLTGLRSYFSGASTARTLPSRLLAACWPPAFVVDRGWLCLSLPGIAHASSASADSVSPQSAVTDAPAPPPQSSPNPDYKPLVTIIVLTHTKHAAALVPSLSRLISRIPSNETCKVTAVASNKIALSFTHASFDFVARAAAAAASLPGTIHVHPRANVRLMNYYATGNIQSGTMNPVAGASPLWEAGSCRPQPAICQPATSFSRQNRTYWQRRGGGMR
jgi:hypothetical protein